MVLGTLEGKKKNRKKIEGTISNHGGARRLQVLVAPSSLTLCQPYEL